MTAEEKKVEELDWSSLLPGKLPVDKDGYVEGFDIYMGDDEKLQSQNNEEILNFFNKYGVIVIKNLLTEEECKNTQNEIYDKVEESFKDFKRDDINTYKYITGLSAKLGMITDLPTLTLQCFKNRQNPKIYKAFSYVLNDNDIYVNIGRVGYFRPTKGLKLDKNDNKLTDKPEWKTVDGKLWLHMDSDPINNFATTFSLMPTQYFKNSKIDKYNKYRVQGVLAVIDCSINDGGFNCVPGFHNESIFNKWINNNYDSIKSLTISKRYQFPKNSQIIKHIQKIGLRKGSIVIWNSRLPHSSYSNNSNSPRMVQYIKFARKDDPATIPVEFNKELIGPWGPWPFTVTLPNDFEMSELGKKVFGIGEYGKKDPGLKDEKNEKKGENKQNNSRICVLL